jgi:hypothetical protein
MARKAPSPQGPRRKQPRGNYISEWFGHRIYPDVNGAPHSVTDQQARRCPFVSMVKERDSECVKPDASRGVCSISSVNRGAQHDWMVCPLRALGSPLVEDATRRLFDISVSDPVSIVAAPALEHQQRRADLLARLAAGERVIIQLHSKLGGEVSVSATQRSPELSFDVTVVEIVATSSGLACLGRYGIVEIQTMDFHGSYRHAVKNLTDALRLHSGDFPATLQSNQQWMSDRVEGPNLANVFKRTFYQMMLKFHIGAHPPCMGCVLAVPVAVWESWQRHLGRPQLVPRADGTYALRVDPDAPPDDWTPTSWIYAFEVDPTSPTSPNPIRVNQVIATDSEALAHYALRVAPDAIVEAGGSVDRVLERVHARLSALWPELAPALPIARSTLPFAADRLHPAYEKKPPKPPVS